MQPPDDWVFASPNAKANIPDGPDTVLAKTIRPAAVRAGIKKRIAGIHFGKRVPINF